MSLPKEQQEIPNVAVETYGQTLHIQIPDEIKSITLYSSSGQFQFNLPKENE